MPKHNSHPWKSELTAARLAKEKKTLDKLLAETKKQPIGQLLEKREK